MRRYAHSKDLEPGVRRSRAMDHRTAGAATQALQPHLWLIPIFWWPRTFSSHSNCHETWQEHRAQVVQRAHSKSERVIARIALNITKTTLVACKTLTAHADISELYKQYPQVGLVLVSRPCHVGRCPTSHIVLQGPGAGARGTDSTDRLPAAEVLKMG